MEGLEQYKGKKTFSYNNKLGKYNVEHRQIIASKGEGFNYPIEGLHNSIRHRQN